MSCKSSPQSDKGRVCADIKNNVKKLKRIPKVNRNWEDERTRNEEEEIVKELERNLRDYRKYAQLGNNQTLEQIQRENDNLRRELDKKDGQIDRLTRERVKGNEEGRKLEKTIDKLTADNKRIQEEFRKKEEQCWRLQEKVQKEEHKNKEVLVKFSDTKRDYESQEKKISSLIKQNDEYKQQLEDREREVERQNKEIQKYEEEKRNLKGHILSQEKKITTLTEDNDAYKQQLKDRKREIERQNREIQKYEEEKGNLNDSVFSLKLANEEYTQANTRLKNTIESFKRSLKESENNRTALRQAIETSKSQIEDLNQQLLESENESLRLKAELESRNQDITKQQGTINNLHKNVVSERRAKEEALTRLSAAAASRLRDNNPGITDLSDPNRPLKLAEKISELYDNEWTNAMETLEDIGVKEEKGVKILLNIFTSLFVKCSDLASDHFDKLQCKLILPSKVWKSAMTKTELDDIPELPTEVFKPLKDFRKTYADKAVIVLQEVLMKEIEDSESPILKDLNKKEIKACEEFVQKCIEICWKMRVQDPPVSMKWDFPENEKFNTDIMRSYTKSGKLVDFVVWPVIYLHKDGPLLGKGVMQGKKENSQNGKNKSQASNGNPPDDNKPSAESGNTEETQEDGSYGNEVREPSTSGKSSSTSMTSSDTNNESEI